MCGITGFWHLPQQLSADRLGAIAERMSNGLRHRGPDDSGVWVDAEAGIALGHRRLAIVDLSPQGHQPMVSANDRYVISFNGEIYNYRELRRQLERLGHGFRGYSDTEVMLAAFSQWGLEPSLREFNGMFAFALWDRQERILYLGRDRLGEKPLYYGWNGQTFLFASELKALKAHPDFQGAIDRDALALYLRYSYIPTPHTIYRGIFKLPPATFLALRLPAKTAEPVSYWSIQSAAESGLARPFPGSELDAIAHLDDLLRDAVALRMVADVPLGAFLSGGIDSSTVVALMQAQSTQPVKTFTIGFYEDSYNEARAAKAVAQHLGTDHTEFYVTPEAAIAIVPKLPTLYDEPFADSSQIPTFLVSQLAREQVTVSLSGDGGDELFAGYNRYFWGRRIWQASGWIPPTGRQLAAGMLTRLSPQAWDRLFHQLDAVLPTPLKQPNPGDKLHKLATVLAAPNPQALYHQLVSHWQQPDSLVLYSTEPPTASSDRQSWTAFPDFTETMMYLDAITYLPDDILVKLDRASMSVSLESRVPLLDPRLVEFAWRVPLNLKIRDGKGKWLLRQVLERYVPQHLIERPKSGFAIPLNRWLRGALRDWAEALLDETRLRQEGFFRPEPIRQAWEDCLAGDSLWNVLMFQAWLERNG